MPTDATGLSLIRDVRDLQRLDRRHQNLSVSGAPFWDYQEFTTAGPNTLRYLPVSLSPHVELNGVGLREGTDYTWNYATGVITLTATFTTGDHLMIRYQTTGRLQVGATPPDTGNLLLETESTFETGMTNWTAAWTATPISRATTGGRTAGGCIVQTATGTASNLAIITTTRGIPVVVGATYEIGVWWKGAITSSTINVNQATSGGTYAGSLGCSSFGGSDTPGADGWAFRSGQFTVPTGVSYVQLDLVPYQVPTVAGDTVTYDDIYLMQV